MKVLKKIVIGNFIILFVIMFRSVVFGDVSTYQSIGNTIQTEPAYSDTYQTAPMPDSAFGEEELLGKWVDSTDPNNIEGIEFYKENNQLMYRYYSILPGNSIGMNTANEVTEWDYCEGIVTAMANQGNIYCHRGAGEEIAVSFYYGFDGLNVMYKQKDGSAYYRE